MPQDEDDKAGPHLFDLFHRGAAGATGYDYSLALQDKGMQWAEGSLFVFLENPKKSVPGIRMLFPGLKQSSDRYGKGLHPHTESYVKSNNNAVHIIILCMGTMVSTDT